MKNFDVEYDVNLTKYNTYGINTSCAYLIRPRTVIEVVEVIDYLKKENIKYYILGGGSNVILPDNHFDGAIIKLDYIDDLLIESDYVFVGAGVPLSLFVQKLMSKNYVNLSKLYGIPGTVGGAIYGNAGANGIDTFTYLESLMIYDNGNISLLKSHHIKHSYRYTEFKDSNKIILGGIFKLEKGDGTKALNEAKELLKKRSKNQPINKKTAGSVFKNTPNQKAWQIIKECGLENKRVNDAKVSTLHANFIENLKNATSHDIIKLISVIKSEVYKKKNIELELEQIVVKW